MAQLRVLAVAINRRRLGYVFLLGMDLKEWRTMTAPTKSQTNAAGALQDLINEFRPDVVVTEKVVTTANRSSAVRALKEALIRAAAQNYVLDVSVERTQDYANKYEEAQSLATIYPDVAPWVPPKRRAFDHEPAHLVIFDALSLAHTVLKNPALKLASGMDRPA